ncbi:MAG: hypothetical protein K6F87_03755 [Lachnospiraceae bacterium]|nr:hypothetical protein [Lachnospiraceae bacterium]
MGWKNYNGRVKGSFKGELDVNFKASYGEHVFTDEEIAVLLDGGYIPITPKNLKPTEGHLQYIPLESGGSYFGFCHKLDKNHRVDPYRFAPENNSSEFGYNYAQRWKNYNGRVKGSFKGELDVDFKASYGEHVFTDEEIAILLDGGYTPITPKNLKPTEGHLQYIPLESGGSYFGFCHKLDKNHRVDPYRFAPENNSSESGYNYAQPSVVETASKAPVVNNQTGKRKQEELKRLEEERKKKEEREQEEKKINEAWSKVPDEKKKEYVKEAYSDYSEYAEPKYPTLKGKLVKSKEEVIIVDRVVHWLGKDSIKYEDRYLTNYNYRPDFCVFVDGTWVLWEHLGGWSTPEELFNYKEKNLKKLSDYLAHFSDPKDLPRVSFPLSEDTDWEELGKSVPNFYDVTSSEDNLKAFLVRKLPDSDNPDLKYPLGVYEEIFRFYKDDLKKYKIELPQKYKEDWGL